MILIVASRKDVASMNIRQQVLSNYDFEKTANRFHDDVIYYREAEGNEVKLVTINEEAIYYQAITDHFSPELIVYLSRHSSKSGTPTLSVHTPGNLASAEKGGIPKRVSVAPANATREALLELTRQRSILSLDYKVSYECTHHGPSLDVAAMFVELGSSPVQWKDAKAAEAVAHAAMASTRKHSMSSTIAVGIGGPHYNEKFTRMALEEDFAFGHIIPKYAVSQVNSDIMKKCIDRTVERVERVVLDWKGIRGADKVLCAKALEQIGVSTQRV
jgi:D-aminoacyl-tRNA deacylase